MRVLENVKSFKPRNLTCSLSSDDYTSDYSDDGGSSSDLTSSILNSVTQLGSAAILASSPNTGVVTPVYSRPVTYSSAPSAMKTSSWLLLAVVVVVGIFAYREL